MRYRASLAKEVLARLQHRQQTAHLGQPLLASKSGHAKHGDGSLHSVTKTGTQVIHSVLSDAAFAVSAPVPSHIHLLPPPDSLALAAAARNFTHLKNWNRPLTPTACRWLSITSSGVNGT